MDEDMQRLADHLEIVRQAHNELKCAVDVLDEAQAGEYRARTAYRAAQANLADLLREDHSVVLSPV